MASVDDIRVLIAWRAHPKRLKLQRRLGAEGVLALLDLWLWAGQNRTDGVLTGMDVDDVEIAAQWTGDAGAFISAALALRLLDKDDAGALRLHDWSDHQGWADGARARSESAREAARVKWAKRSGADKGDAPAMRPYEKQDAPALPAQAKPHASAMPLSISVSVSDPISDPHALPPPARDPRASATEAPFTSQAMIEAWTAARLGVGPNSDGWQEIEILGGKVRDTAEARGESPHALVPRILAAWPEMCREWGKRNRAPRGRGPRKLNEHFAAVVEWLDGGGREVQTAAAGGASDRPAQRKNGLTPAAEPSDFSHLGENEARVVDLRALMAAADRGGGR